MEALPIRGRRHSGRLEAGVETRNRWDSGERGKVWGFLLLFGFEGVYSMVDELRSAERDWRLRAATILL